MAPLIEIKGLTKKYRLGREVITAVNNVNLSIEPGEFVCILGPSGSGKTTLLHLVAGLEKPTKGDIFVKGVCINKIKESDMALFRRRFMAFIFQSYNLVKTFTSVENVAMPLMFDGVSKLKREKRAKQLLTQIGLGDRLRNKPTEMSGGQQQRVSIARALINDPKIIYADEPTGNLDSKTTQEIMDILISRVRESHVTLVMVTHNEELTEYADRIIFMRDGQLNKIENKKTGELTYFDHSVMDENEDAKDAEGTKGIKNTKNTEDNADTAAAQNIASNEIEEKNDSEEKNNIEEKVEER